MKADGFDQVVDRPGEGAEVGPRRRVARPARSAPHRIPMLGLGMSVGTPRDGIEADLLVVGSFAELERRSAEARGRIVLFNAPYRGYGQTVAYRTNGASQAAQHGAVAMLVRSVGPDGLRTPHTGMLDLPRRRAADSGRGDPRRRRTAARAPGGWRPAAARAPEDGGASRSGRRLGQRHRRVARTRTPRRDRRRVVPFRLVGCRHRRQRRCRRVRSQRGKRRAC